MEDLIWSLAYNKSKDEKNEHEILEIFLWI